ncbi:MAG: ABC-2 family transporter protein, partial [Oscillospiraceae bacterium]|nr:ABC-2 family transporter protein [Oscillospiraceae bacterium]
MRKDFKLYWKYITINLLSGLEYKGWWMMCVQTVFIVITDPISTVLLFSRFGSVGVWTMERILLVYSLAVTSFGLAQCFCRGFDCFPWKMIRTGEFDRLLLRPRSLFTQTAGSYFHIHRLPRVLTGLCVIFWALHRIGAPFSLVNAIILPLALLGGFFAYAGVFVMTSGIAFFTVKGLDWIYIFTNASCNVTRCPVDYLPKLLRGVFTFFMPMFVVSYYPASVICGWGEPLFTGFLSLPAGLAFLG